MMPLGSRWKSYSMPSTTTVWPALLPPCTGNKNNVKTFIFVEIPFVGNHNCQSKSMTIRFLTWCHKLKGALVQSQKNVTHWFMTARCQYIWRAFEYMYAQRAHINQWVSDLLLPLNEGALQFVTLIRKVHCGKYRCCMMLIFVFSWFVWNEHFWPNNFCRMVGNWTNFLSSDSFQINIFKFWVK